MPPPPVAVYLDWQPRKVTPLYAEWWVGAAWDRNYALLWRKEWRGYRVRFRTADGRYWPLDEKHPNKKYLTIPEATKAVREFIDRHQQEYKQWNNKKN